MFRMSRTIKDIQMDGLTAKIISNNRTSIKMAKTLITTPALINQDSTQGAVYAVSLAVESNQMSANAEVSESLLITQDAKQYIADNVAPGSKTWNLSGYIAGNKQLEPTNFYKPLMRLNADILWQWFNRGAVLKYRDGNAQLYEQVVIKSLQTSQQKDAADAIAFSMTLKEINVMEISDEEVSDNTTGFLKGLKKSLPAQGSTLGMASAFGTVTSSLISNIAF